MAERVAQTPCPLGQPAQLPSPTAPWAGGLCAHLHVPAGVRDYIHVVDLAKGHIAALKKLEENCGCKVRRGPLSGWVWGWARAGLSQPPGS